MTDKLKSCPATCIHSGDYSEPPEVYRGAKMFAVCCPICGATTELFDTEAEAVAKWNVRAPLTTGQLAQVPSVDDDDVDNLLLALDYASHGYSIRLTRLVDGVETYTLTYHGEQHEFEGCDDARSALEDWQMREKREAAKKFIAALKGETK